MPTLTNSLLAVRPLGRFTVDGNPAYKRALERAKAAAQSHSNTEDHQFESADDWVSKLQHRVLSLYSNQQKAFEHRRLVQRLFRACERGHADDARQILTEDVDAMHGKDIAGLATLVIAAINGSADVMQVLVDFGAFMEHTDEHGNTPFVLASHQGGFRICRILHAAGCHVDAQNGVRKGALHYAVLAGRLRYAELLLNVCKCSPSVTDVFGMSPLLCAVETGKEAIVRLLLKHGASPDERNGASLTCLMISSINREPRIAQALIDHGAGVDALDGRGETVLMMAAQRGQTEFLDMLLRAGANKDLTTRQGETALDLAVLLRKKRAERVLRR